MKKTLLIVFSACFFVSCANTSNSNAATDSTGFNNASNNTIRTDTNAKAGANGPANDNNQNLSTDSSLSRSSGNNGSNTTNGVNGSQTTRTTSDRGKK